MSVERISFIKFMRKQKILITGAAGYLGSSIATKLVNLGQQLKNDTSLISESVNTMENSYDIRLNNEDYTIGKILEYILYKKYFVEEETLSYCGFIKEHPHNDYSIIRIAFKNIVENNNIISIFDVSIKMLIQIFTKIQDNFTS